MSWTDVVEDGEPTLDPARMADEIAGDWPLWSGIVERAAVARMESLKRRFPELTSAVLSTADGMHIASIGVDEMVGDRLAAMNASLFGVARAEAAVIAESAVPSLSAVVSVTIGDRQAALLSFVLEPFGQLLFSVSATSVQLGTIIVHARTAAADLKDALGKRIGI